MFVGELLVLNIVRHIIQILFWVKFLNRYIYI